MADYTYIGNELELFSQAKNWKNYVRQQLRKYIRGSVLEIGAGIGSNTSLLNRCSYDKWSCVEPDLNLFQTLELSISANKIDNCRAYYGTIDNLDKQQQFDCILYLDVLEHIYNDQEELVKASNHLTKNGYLIVLAPAHQWLFTPFDASINHYRRYNKQMLKAILPTDIKIDTLIYLDCVGLLASLGNKLILNQSKPTLKQIKTWDNLMVPLSTKLDPILGYNLGKSVLLIGSKK